MTDADLVLGRLAPDATLGGSIQLDRERARHALRSLGEELGLDAVEAALGVLRVVHAAMHRAIRRVSVERGQDPRRCVLVAFGGAGPMHAAELADELDIARVLIPPFPGVESACGMAAADELHDFSLTVKALVERDHDAAVLAELWRPLAAEIARFDSAHVRRSADVRYVGQSFEIEVPADDLSAIVDRFDEAHEGLYGFAQRQAAVEIVNVRARAITPNHVRLRSPARAEAGDERWTTMRFASGEHRARLVERATLDRLDGPALVVQPDTTTVVPPGWSATADEFGNLLLQAMT